MVWEQRKMATSIPLFKVFMSEEAKVNVQQVLESGMLTQGSQVEAFESELKSYFDHPFLLTLNSATSGLSLALHLLKNPLKELGWPGFDDQVDEVLTPALTCFATTASILSQVSRIQWLDVDSTTLNVDLDDLCRKLTARTKVVYVVHWGGNPVDLHRLKDLQQQHYERFGYRFMVVEDCAHAFGATFNGKKLGTHGNICVYSLQAIKHLTTGDGGIILLPHQTWYERARLLRWYGIDRDKRNYQRKDLRLEHNIEEWGYKFHMNDINASMGRGNLLHMEDLLEKHRHHAHLLRTGLQDIEEIIFMSNHPLAKPSWWLFSICLKYPHKRDRLVSYLKEHGITASQVHRRNDVHTCVQAFRIPLPQLDRLETSYLCLPVGWWLTSDDREHIIKTMKAFFVERPKVLIELRLATQTNDEDPTMEKRDVRKQQYIHGLNQFFHYCHQWPYVFDVMVSDNTTDTLDDEILSCIPKETIIRTCVNNTYGAQNKGAGDIEQWEYNMNIIQRYEWLVHFEPRMELVDDKFFRDFFTQPRTMFTWGSSNCDHFFTGLNSIRTADLERFCHRYPAKQLTDQGLGIEHAMYHMLKSTPDLCMLDRVHVVWHDAYGHRDVPY